MSVLSINGFDIEYRLIESPTPIDDYNRRFGKLPRDRHDAHRAVRQDKDLDAVFAWREFRKVTKNLTLRYERKMYLIDDTPGTPSYPSLVFMRC
jgi:hypothetical protein